MTNLNKIWHQIRLFMIPSRIKRLKYLKDKGYFRSVGENSMINSYRIPLYTNLISIGNNVWVASDVTFITHDVIHYMLNGLDKDRKYTEKIGPINIEDNVFIGNGVRIMYDVNIGANSIIAAGSIVTKDTESNSIYAGVPAKKIGSFNDFFDKRKIQELQIDKNILKNHISGVVTDEEANYLWKDFFEKRNK